MTGRPLSASRFTQLLALVGIAAVAACGDSTRPIDRNEDETESGGSSGSKAGKGGNGGGNAGSNTSSNNAGSSGSSTSKGGSGGGSAGSASTAGSAGTAGSGAGTAGSAGKSGGGAGTAGSAGKSGGTGGSAGSGDKGAGGSGAGTGGAGQGGGGGAAGTTEIVCSNTDKSILPVDETGWVDKTCNTCGIQGAFYWYGDDNTKANLKCGGAACEDAVPPWSATSKGMCISGKATGSSDDWGAGIGLSLNDSGGETSVKGSFDASGAACGKIVGFDLTLSGDTNGMPVRVGFSTSKDGSTISPFIEVPDPGGKETKLSGSSEILITNAKIPTDWKSTDPSPPDPSKIYDLQIQVAADTADADTAFEICILDVKPVTSGGAGGGSGSNCKTTSGGSLGSDTQIKDMGTYAFQTNANAVGSGSCSTTGYTGSGCAGLAVSTSGIKSNGDAPAAYPSLIQGWHWGKGFFGAYKSAKKISDLKTVKSSMSFTPPGGNKWDVAYDIWVDSSNPNPPGAPGNSALEVMVWLDYSGQVTTNPIGSKTGKSVDFSGDTWEVWSGTNSGGWKVVSYRRGQSTAAVTDLDLLQFIKDAVSVAGMSTGSYLLGVQSGFELFDASSGGSIDSYTLTIN